MFSLASGNLYGMRNVSFELKFLGRELHSITSQNGLKSNAYQYHFIVTLIVTMVLSTVSTLSEKAPK